MAHNPSPWGKEKERVVSLEQYRWHRTAQELRRKIAEFADHQYFAMEAARAQERYFSCLSPELVDQSDEFTLERCFEWFIFDYTLPDGSTVIEAFRQMPGLSEMERALLADWVDARFSLYEVERTFPGKGVVLRDILRKQKVWVRDANASVELQPKTVLFIRVLKVGEEYEFSTSGLALPGFYKHKLLQEVRRDWWSYARSRKAPPRQVLDEYLRERSHVMNAMVIEVGSLLREPYLSLLNTIREAVNQEISQWLEDIGLERRGPRAPFEERRVEDYQWPSPGHAEVAREVARCLEENGFNAQQVQGALKMWYDFCEKARPALRKPALWVAAVVYAASRLEGDFSLSQRDLAQRYGVPSSSISACYRSICRVLELEAFDERYSTFNITEFLTKVLHDLTKS